MTYDDKEMKNEAKDLRMTLVTLKWSHESLPTALGSKFFKKSEAIIVATRNKFSQTHVENLSSAHQAGFFIFRYSQKFSKIKNYFNKAVNLKNGHQRLSCYFLALLRLERAEDLAQLIFFHNQIQKAPFSSCQTTMTK